MLQRCWVVPVTIFSAKTFFSMTGLLDPQKYPGNMSRSCFALKCDFVLVLKYEIMGFL